ncbi:MAG TPA: molybdopterin cofactor-binding domain-containing protein [Gemmatimonadaceae bacterium]|jgi:nicotinate dehydrogenase subunit B|nr:molybdopterin cofactor-binding domain-containing protein [Gemmatimonadaceae bacterium]
MLQSALSRREFVKDTGVLIVGFSLMSLVAPGCVPRGTSAAAKTLDPGEVDAYLSIDAHGAVTVYSGKVDLGTGIRTAMTQIAAEELDVPVARVDVIEGDTALTPDQGPSYGSLSVQNGGMQLRQAAATARAALITEAAKQLDALPGDFEVENGIVRSRTSGKSVTYGELVGGRSFALKVDKDAPLKAPASYSIVGRSVARLDIPAKVFGQFIYMQDFRVPGMVHGRVVRPTGMGATLQSVDERSVQEIPGMIKVVREGNFLGVVAETEWGAITAAQKLTATWSNWDGLPEQSKLWEYVRSTKVVKDDVTSNVGAVDQALASAKTKLSATYDFAIHTHGSIGPSCAVVEIKEGSVTCWSASQATHNLRQQLAEMLSLPVEEVRAIYVEGAGCYGRNGHEDAAADAALLARAVGRPVRVQWMRADEHGWDPKGPPTLIDVQAGLDANRAVVAWSSQFFIPQGAAGKVKLLAADLASLPAHEPLSPGGILNDTAIPYAFPNVRTVAHRLVETPFRPSWIRSPGRLQNTFANEAFLDELIVAVGADPIAFRIQYLNDPRGAEVLNRLTQLARWDTHPTRAKRDTGAVVTGRGVSYVKYELYRTYVGMVATVQVNRTTGAIRATHFAVVHDCGQIINPDGVRNQIEGNVVQTVSRVLKEEVTFNRSRVTSVDWVTYPILTFPEIPDVDIALIDRPTEKPWGAGEPTAAVVPAAIANAVFDAIGVRLRSVPFTPAKVKEAMARAGGRRRV